MVKDSNLDMTASTLNDQKLKDLAQLAKKKGISGWHSMRKEQLIRALLKLVKEKEAALAAKKSISPKSTSKQTATKPTVAKQPQPSIKRVGAKQTDAIKSVASTAKSSNRIRAEVATSTKSSRIRKPVKPEPFSSDSPIAKKIRADRELNENRKNLAYICAAEQNEHPPQTDRLVLVVRDAFWLQAYWEITKATVARAKVALDGSWHLARPAIRLLEITSDGNTNRVEKIVQEIEIHGGTQNWYVQIKRPARAFRVAIGYAVPDGRFHLISKSNQVVPPSSTATTVDEHWTDLTNDAERYYATSGGYDPSAVSGDLQAVFEEKSRRPMNAPAFERLGSGINGCEREFEFQVDAHLVVYGNTSRDGNVTINGDPVRLQSDGSFSLKIDLPDKRQVLPIIASSRDGTQQRTTVLAVERNTKVMEPMSSDVESM